MNSLRGLINRQDIMHQDGKFFLNDFPGTHLQPALEANLFQHHKVLKKGCKNHDQADALLWFARTHVEEFDLSTRDGGVERICTTYSWGLGLTT